MKIAALLFLAGMALQLSGQTARNPTHIPSEQGQIVLRGTNHPECPANSILPQALPDGRMLFGVVDTVYMVNGTGRILWKYVANGPEQPLSLAFAPSLNTRTNEVGVIGCDLFFVRLDAGSGKEKWRTRVNGSSEYTQIAAYDSGFLLVVKSHGSTELQYWSESEDDFWQVKFPPKARLLVNSTRIFAMTDSGRSVRVQLIDPKSHRR